MMKNKKLWLCAMVLVSIGLLMVYSSLKYLGIGYKFNDMFIIILKDKQSLQYIGIIGMYFSTY